MKIMVRPQIVPGNKAVGSVDYVAIESDDSATTGEYLSG